MILHPSFPSFFDPGTTPEAHPREIHIWELPEGFYIQLESSVTRELVNRAAESVGGIKQLARVLKVHPVTIFNYRTKKTFLPFPALLKLCEHSRDEFAIERVEPHVVAYKGGHGATPIQNPHLPLKESPDLFALMAHLIGDGGYDSYRARYHNTNKALIAEFLRLLRSVFGDLSVEVSTRKRSPWKVLTRVSFSHTLVRLLRYLYQVDFKTFTARVPQRLFDLPRAYAAAFLRAFGDDEGSVSDYDIQLYSANKQLLQGIYTLIQMKFPEIAEFAVFDEHSRKPNHCYVIRFRTGAFASYRKLIGFTHPGKKQILERNLARRARGWRHRKNGETRRMLLEALRLKPMTRHELAKALNVTVRPIQRHLKGLMAIGTVIRAAKIRKAYIYVLTETGRKLLEVT